MGAFESRELITGGLVVVVVCSSLLNIGFNLLAGIFCCIFFHPNLHLLTCMHILKQFQHGMLLLGKFCKKAILIMKNITLKQRLRDRCHSVISSPRCYCI